MFGEGVPGATVWACRRSVATDGGGVRSCRYATVTASDGTFRIVGVAASERPYVLLAFVDADAGFELCGGPGATAAGIQIELADDLEEEMPAIMRGEE